MLNVDIVKDVSSYEISTMTKHAPVTKEQNIDARFGLYHVTLTSYCGGFLLLPNLLHHEIPSVESEP